MTPALRLALTRAAVLSLVGTAGGRDICMAEPADDLGGGVPVALIATVQGELVPDCVAGWAGWQARGRLQPPTLTAPGAGPSVWLYSPLPRADP